MAASLQKKNKTEQRRKSHGMLFYLSKINLYMPRKKPWQEQSVQKVYAKKHIIVTSTALPGRKLCRHSMDLILISLQLESIINFEKLTEWTSSNVMEERKIKVYLPRMKMEEKYNLTSVLMAMGITDVFSSSANLSGISSAESLKISQAVHAAHAEINEAGREVVGSAEAGVDAASVSEEFRADHPFLFCIKHIATNAVLFFGRCVSP